MTRARGSSRAPDERADKSDFDKADSHLPVEVTERSPRRTLDDARTPPGVSDHRSAADVIEQHSRGMQRAPSEVRSPRPADRSSDDERASSALRIRIGVRSLDFD